MTVGPEDAARLARVRAIVAPQHAGRAIDLACGVGVFSHGLAEMGYDVTGIDGRQENIDAAVQVESSAGFLVQDVRALELDDFGPSSADVVLCLGILYHLEAEDQSRLLAFVRQIVADDGVVIVDTHVSLGGGNASLIDGVPFYGHAYSEGDSGGPWSSLGNPTSWWFNPAWLEYLMKQRGFKVTPLPGPAYEGEPADRRWYLLEPKVMCECEC